MFPRPWLPAMYKKFSKKERQKLARRARKKNLKMVRKYKDKNGVKRVPGAHSTGYIFHHHILRNVSLNHLGSKLVYR